SSGAGVLHAGLLASLAHVLQSCHRSTDYYTEQHCSGPADHRGAPHANTGFSPRPPAVGVPVPPLRESRLGAEDVILPVGDDVGDFHRDLLMAPGADIDFVGRGDPAHLPRAVSAALGPLEPSGERFDIQLRVRLAVGALSF